MPVHVREGRVRRRCLQSLFTCTRTAWKYTLGCFKINFLENHKLFDVFDFTDVSRHMVSAGKSNSIKDDLSFLTIYDLAFCKIFDVHCQGFGSVVQSFRWICPFNLKFSTFCLATVSRLRPFHFNFLLNPVDRLPFVFIMPRRCRTMMNTMNPKTKIDAIEFIKT